MAILRWKFGLLFLLCIGLTGAVRAQSNPLDEMPRRSLSELFSEAQAFIAEHPDSPTGPGCGWLIELLRPIGHARSDSVPPGLLPFLENLADTPVNHIAARCSALEALRLFNTPQNHDRMVTYLSGEHCFRVNAAKALVHWGYWDEGSPTLIVENEFRFLVDADRARARPVLENALVNSSPDGQMKAAGLLTHYGDTTALLAKSHAILAEYLGGMKSYPDSMDLARAVYSATKFLWHRTDDSVIPWLGAGLVHPSQSLRLSCVHFLEPLAEGGDNAALDWLVEAARSNPYEDTRQQCVDFLSRLNHAPRGK